MQNRLPTRDIVLIGAGHTHMHVVRMWRMDPIPDTRLTLINPFSLATYSGMLPGSLAGHYDADDMQIDLWRFASSSGIRVIVSPVTGLDPDRRMVLLPDRPPVRFDVASVGIGSVPVDTERWRGCQSFLPVKPMADFRLRLIRRLTEVTRAAVESPLQVNVAVVGGGAAGVEVTLCLNEFLIGEGVKPSITLLESGDDVLRGYEPGTVDLVRQELGARSIQCRTNVTAESIGDKSMTLTGGESLPADLVIWVTAASPPPLLHEIDLPKADDGFLAVRNTLQSTADVPVFAVGDSGTLIDNPVHKAGVYAVREGPILWENLRRKLDERPLISYRPQSGFLSLLADGRGKAFLEFKGRTTHGRWVWKLKDWIDRRFMRMYHDYRPMMAQSSDTADEAPVMRCKGCGGKAGAGVLSAALQKLAESAPEDASSHRALGHPEDAARLDPQGPTSDLISVDFFQSFMDDPWIVGRVSALNSLSDLWAMGSRPTGAMAMVQIPEGHPRQQVELLFHVLSGALHEFRKAGVELLGGHTTEGSELTAGFTVLGSLEGLQPLQKSGVKPGDRLLVTKALGTGSLLAGIPLARTAARWVDAMLESMLQSNEAASRVARECGAASVTDVTGFGLAGHLLEMLDASGVSARLSLEAIPLLPGALDLWQEGLESTLAPHNRGVESRVRFESVEIESRKATAALYDPQTSGGLLIAVERDAADEVTKSLAEAGVSAWEIGEATRVSANPEIEIVH